MCSKYLHSRLELLGIKLGYSIYCLTAHNLLTTIDILNNASFRDPYTVTFACARFLYFFPKKITRGTLLTPRLCLLRDLRNSKVGILEIGAAQTANGLAYVYTLRGSESQTWLILQQDFPISLTSKLM